MDIFPTGCNVGKSGGSPTATTDSNACGFWSFSGVTSGQYDVRITSGCSVRFIRYDNEQNVCRLEIRNLVLNDGSANLYTINLASTSTDRTLTVPDVCGNRTFQFIDQAQTISALHTYSVDIRMQDNADVSYGTGLDSLIRWSTGDASNHAMVIAVGQSNQVLHIAEACDVGFDWNQCANAADTEVQIHSSTSPDTDYLMIGRHTGTRATIDVVGGTGLCIDVSGTTILSIASDTGVVITNENLKMCTGSTPFLITWNEKVCCGCNTVSITAPDALTCTWTLKLPPTNGASGQQLRTDGSGVTTWTAACSSEETKDIHGTLCRCAAKALASIVTTPVYDFTYKSGRGTGDYTTHYTGVLAADMPDVMHEGGTIFSSLSAFGKTSLAIKELAARISALE